MISGSDLGGLLGVGLSVLVVGLRQDLGQTLSDPADHSGPAGEAAVDLASDGSCFFFKI